jgi:glyoxylase-like metal-dependent hydrolase (beta-lactamase superfamily II)
LHADHVGWNMRLLNGRWVPTFPRAKYIFGKKEFEYWDQLFRTSDPAGHHLAAFVDSVVPIVDAGEALIVDNSFSLEDCMTIEPAPGHTPGACCVFSGDIIHHLVQLRHLDWSCMGCQDPNQSASTRSALLSEIADADVHLVTGHFLAPHVCRIKSTAQNFKLECRS